MKWLCQVMSTKIVSIASVSRSKSCFFRCRYTRFAVLSLAWSETTNFSLEFESDGDKFSILHGVEFANTSGFRFCAIKCRNLHKKPRKAVSIFRPRKDILRTIQSNYINLVRLSIFVYTIRVFSTFEGSALFL